MEKSHKTEEIEGIKERYTGETKTAGQRFRIFLENQAFSETHTKHRNGNERIKLQVQLNTGVKRTTLC